LCPRKFNRVVVSTTFKPVIVGAHLSDVYAVTLGRNDPAPTVWISGQFTALFIIIDDIKNGRLFSDAEKPTFFLMVHRACKYGCEDCEYKNQFLHSLNLLFCTKFRHRTVSRNVKFRCGDDVASRVPALGCDWKYLILGGLQAY